MTGSFPGTYEAVAAKFCVARSTVCKVWKCFFDSNQLMLPKGGASRNRTKLSEEDLEIIEALNVRKGSISLSEICEELAAMGAQENIHTSTVSREL